MLEYGKLTMADAGWAASVYREYLNGGRGIEEHVGRVMADPDFVGVKCTEQGELAGVFTAAPGIEFTYEHQELARRIQNSYGRGKIYTGDMLAVLPRYRGAGVARELTRAIRQELVYKGAEFLVVEMWNPLLKGDLPAGGIMKYLGPFVQLWSLPDFYKDLYSHGLTCPYCGNGPCRCGAAVGVIKL